MSGAKYSGENGKGANNNNIGHGSSHLDDSGTITVAVPSAPNPVEPRESGESRLDRGARAQDSKSQTTTGGVRTPTENEDGRDTTIDENSGGGKRPVSKMEGEDTPAKSAKKARKEESSTATNDTPQPFNPATPEAPQTGTPKNNDTNFKSLRHQHELAKRLPDNPKKHTPVCPRGTTLRWSDNTHLDQTRFVVGKPEKNRLKLKMKCTKGKVYTWRYPGRLTIDWNKKADIEAANKWRKQAIDRRLSKAGDPESRKRESRPQWSEKEMFNVQGLVKTRIQKVKRRLRDDDWVEITKKHNERYAGTEVQIGERLAPSLSAQGKLSKGGVNKTVHKIVERSTQAIYNQATGRWPDMKQMIADEYAKIGAESEGGGELIGLDSMDVDGSAGEERDGDNLSEDMADEGLVDEDGEDESEGEHGGVFGPPLEDPSDDEKDGMRPASTQNGARLVEVSG